jgi:hypothetical protein
MGDDTMPHVNEEDIPAVLWIIIAILRGESGRPDSRHRSLAVTHIEDAIYRLYADQQEKADQKEKEKLG